MRVGPTSPRRVDRLEQDLTAVAGTVVDIKETVDAIERTQRDHGVLLQRIAAHLEA